MTASFTDWKDICETKARYCRCMDTKDWAGYADCFTEDYVLETPPDFSIQGRDAAVKAVRAWVETANTAHQVHNPEIDFAADGLSADVTWAMQDRVTWGPERETGEKGHTGYGHYREHYVKCDDGRWRIKRLKLSYLSMDHYDR